ncbi:MAG: hypothetical protein ACTSW4_00830 [Candidatus Ranarchaeia archaeon]
MTYVFAPFNMSSWNITDNTHIYDLMMAAVGLGHGEAALDERRLSPSRLDVGGHQVDSTWNRRRVVDNITFVFERRLIVHTITVYAGYITKKGPYTTTDVIHFLDVSSSFFSEQQLITPSLSLISVH